MGQPTISLLLSKVLRQHYSGLWKRNKFPENKLGPWEEGLPGMTASSDAVLLGISVQEKAVGLDSGKPWIKTSKRPTQGCFLLLEALEGSRKI